MIRILTFFLFFFCVSHSALAQTSLEVYIDRCKDLRPKIEEILVEQELPTYFFYLALAESGCKFSVESHKGAKGLFQLTPSTYLFYSKGVCGKEDEPCPLSMINDPIISSKVAARYLKSLYLRFDKDLDWTIAAYNAGGTNLKRKTGYKKGLHFSVVRKVYPESYNLALKVKNFALKGL